MSRNVEILKQGQYSPLTVSQQQAIIFCGTKGLLIDVPVKEMRDFETLFLETMESKHKEILDQLQDGKLTDEVSSVLENLAKELTAKYRKNKEDKE